MLCASVSTALALVLSACTAFGAPGRVRTEQVVLEDSARGRAVPVTVYRPGGSGPHPLAILSHGYGGKNTAYRFVAEALVRDGWVVAAPQHDLPGDPPSPTGDKLYERRLPFWRNGVRDIDLVTASLRRRKIASGAPIALVGHSNGGDIAMLYATEHPDRVRAAVSLDNRRHPLPRTRRPRVCSVRSADQPADPGVLPSATEAARFEMAIVPVAGLLHNDMWDGALEPQKAAMLSVVRRCIGGGR